MARTDADTLRIMRQLTNFLHEQWNSREQLQEDAGAHTITLTLNEAWDALLKIDRPSFNEDVHAFTENAHRLTRILNRLGGTGAFHYEEVPPSGGGFQYTYRIQATFADDTSYRQVQHTLGQHLLPARAADNAEERMSDHLLQALIPHIITDKQVGTVSLNEAEKALLAKTVNILNRKRDGIKARFLHPVGTANPTMGDLTAIAVRLPLANLESLSDAERERLPALLQRITGVPFTEEIGTSMGKVLQARFGVQEQHVDRVEVVRMNDIDAFAREAAVALVSLRKSGFPLRIQDDNRKFLAQHGLTDDDSPPLP